MAAELAEPSWARSKFQKITQNQLEGGELGQLVSRKARLCFIHAHRQTDGKTVS